MNNKSILILGSVSFTLDKARVGINYIAEYLSRNGFDVIYFSSPSSPFDILSKTRRNRFKLAWLKGGEVKINDHLTEVFPKSPWILNKTFCRMQIMLATLFNRKYFNVKYDVLISTVGALNVFGRYVNADKKILRFQDSPVNFGMSNIISKEIDYLISIDFYDQIWSVSHGLIEYANKITKSKNYYLPNGVKLSNFLSSFMTNKSIKKCIYVGAFDDWVDINLIVETAKLLDDWRFDLFGKGLKVVDLPDNVFYHGEVEHSMLSDVFKEHSVGLIPFLDTHVTKVIERPLKFSEYLASGLGVACTDLKGLRYGLERWASFGSDANSFALAIKDAYEMQLQFKKEKIEEYLSEYNWDIVLSNMQSLLLDYETKNFIN